MLTLHFLIVVLKKNVFFIRGQMLRYLGVKNSDVHKNFLNGSEGGWEGGRERDREVGMEGDRK